MQIHIRISAQKKAEDEGQDFGAMVVLLQIKL